MSYLIYRAFQRIRIHKWVYMLVELQILIGVVILMICCHSFLSAKQKMNEYLELTQNDMVEIQVYPNQSNGDISETAVPFSSIDYQYATSLYPQTESVNCIAAATWPIDSDILVYIVGVAPNYFDSLFDVEMNDSCAYLSSKLFNTLELKTYKDEKHDISLHIQSNSATLQTANTQFSLCDLPSSSPEQIFLSLNEGLNLDVDQCIFIDMALFPDTLRANLIQLRLPNDTTAVQLLDYLRQQHGSAYTYTLQNLRADAQKRMDDLGNNSELLFVISIMLFVVVATGLIGILLIFTNSRKQDMAITQVYGATGTQIRIEFLCEVNILYAFGYGFGSLLSGALAPLFSTALFPVQFQPVSLIIGAFLVLLCTTAVYAITISEIKNATIHTILAGER